MIKVTRDGPSEFPAPLGECAKKIPPSSQAPNIQFIKSIMTREDEACPNLKGSIAITQDDNHTGLLHKVIYGFQKMDIGLSRNRALANANLCHLQMVQGVVEENEKKGHLILGHAITEGVVKTTEDHKQDELITGINIYTPTEEKIRKLLIHFIDQTTENLAQETKKGEKSLREGVGQYSVKKLIGTVFHRQKVHPSRKQRTHLCYAVADLLRGEKLKNRKGELKSFYCTSYVITLTQAAVIIAALKKDRIEQLKTLTRDQIAQEIHNQILRNGKDNLVSARYWQNDFMRIDARYTMTYFAGTVLDRNSIDSRKKLDRQKHME